MHGTTLDVSECYPLLYKPTGSLDIELLRKELDDSCFMKRSLSYQ